jgi:2',3'-cyclic-nucleotide 2'-phosphodiesterase (5'-nucleotidase family)
MLMRYRIIQCAVVLSLLLNACAPKKLAVKSIATNAVVLNKNSAEDKEFVDLINPYKTQIDKEMNQVLIVSSSAAMKGQPEGDLGNLVSDIILVKANEYAKEKVDVCMLNNGGLRTSLPAGEITLGKVFELMPFENEMVVVTLDGKQVQKMFNYAAKEGGMPMSGATAEIKDTVAVNIMIGGVAFDVNKNYKVATSDYLAAGGDKMKFFKQPVAYEPMKKKIRDAIIEYMVEENKKGNKLNPHKDGRFKKQ